MTSFGKTADANSPSVGASTIWVSIAVFGLLYAALAVLDLVLLRRFARVDPPEVWSPEEPRVPALTS